MVCGRCKAVWYHGKACQKSHWKEHKKECAKLAADKTVRGYISGRKCENLSQLTLYNLGSVTGSAMFKIHNGVLVVEFADAETAKKWCDIANGPVFSNQQGSILMLRDGQKAIDLAYALRLPMEMDHFIRYVEEGTIYYHESRGWLCNPPKEIGHWEVGYGQEPFKTWMERQFERMVCGTVVYRW